MINLVDYYIVKYLDYCHWVSVLASCLLIGASGFWRGNFQNGGGGTVEEIVLRCWIIN